MRSKKFLFFLFAILFLYFGSESSAKLGKFRTSKKPAKIAQKRSLNSATRSPRCEKGLKPNSVELLVPEDKIAHKTRLANPPLYFKVNTTEPVTLKFVLVDSVGSAPLAKKTISIQQPGIQKISLPPKVKLQENKIYLWNLAVACSKDNYQGVLRAGIERIPESNIIAEEKVENAKTNFPKIQLYADNEVWYETLDLAVNEARLGYGEGLEQLLLSSRVSVKP